MDRSRKILIAGIGLAAGAAALFGAAPHICAEQFLRLAMDRQMPAFFQKGKTQKQIQGYETEDQVKEGIRLLSRRLRETPHERVQLQGRDGTLLVGHWFPVEEPERVIIAMHGWRSSWASDFCGVADFWRDNRCSVLYAEQRGQGSSGGEYIGFGLLERYDCVSWAHWAQAHCGDQVPIYLSGISMGATTVLMASDLQLPENVRGIMADCGFTGPDAIWEHIARHNLHLPYSRIGRQADRLCRKQIGVGSRQWSTVDSLRKSTVPVLLIHGAQDHFVPVEMTYENYQACAAPRRLLIVPGADHGMSYVVEHQQYEQAVLDFWHEFDR